MTLVGSACATKSRTYSVLGSVTIVSGVPTCTKRPSSMIAIRSPSRSASSRSCVMNKTVRPSWRCRRIISSCICILINGSSALNGSSIRSTLAPVAIARARPTRCCMPPDSELGGEAPQPPKPTISMTSSARFIRSARATPLISSPYATFSRTLRCGSRPKRWNTIAKWSCRMVRSLRASTLTTSTSPSSVVNQTWPDVGSISRLMARRSVDLPEPESPLMTKNSPGFKVNETSWTPITWPVSARMSSLLRPSRSSARAWSGFGPNTLLRDSTRIKVVPGSLADGGRAWNGRTRNGSRRRRT